MEIPASAESTKRYRNLKGSKTVFKNDMTTYTFFKIPKTSEFSNATVQ